jgi:hypothetical protein
LRQIVTVLAWIGLGTVPLALADPPAPNTAAPAASSTSSSTQPPNSADTKETSSTAPTAAVPAERPAAPPSDVDPREKLLLRMGFRPRMQNGQKLFCKREQQLGSRVEGTMFCGTVDHLVNEFRLSREAIDQTQRYGTNPQGN